MAQKAPDQYPFRKHVTTWLGSLAIGTLLLLAIIWWQDQSAALAIEELPQKVQSDLKHTLFSKFTDSRYNLKDFIFINVSHDKEVIADDNTGQREVITDRKLLDTLFQKLVVTGTYRYVVCDLVFPTSTPYDSTLRITINKMKRVAFVTRPEGLRYDSTSFLSNLPGGSGNYSFVSSWYEVSSSIFKFPLFDRSERPTLPLVMFQQLERTHANGAGTLLRFSGRSGYYLSKVPLDPVIRPFSLMADSLAKPVFDIGGLLTNLSGKDIVSAKNYLADKIIVIADFENDHHTTIYGEMPGALLLVNTFISLANGDNVISRGWLFVMLALFTLLAHVLFFNLPTWPNRVYRWMRWVFQFFFKEALSEFIVNSILLWLISAFSYFIFHIAAEVFFLALLVTIAQFVQRRVLNWRQARKTGGQKSNFIRYLLKSFIRENKYVNEI